MYLHQQMEGMDGKLYQMADVIKGKAYRTPRLTRFGYITLIWEAYLPMNFIILILTAVEKPFMHQNRKA